MSMMIVLLLAAHFVCDYPLQGDFLAKAKATSYGGWGNLTYEVDEYELDRGFKKLGFRVKYVSDRRQKMQLPVDKPALVSYGALRDSYTCIHCCAWDPVRKLFLDPDPFDGPPPTHRRSATQRDLSLQNYHEKSWRRWDCHAIVVLGRRR